VTVHDVVNWIQDSHSSGYGREADSYEYGNETTCCINGKGTGKGVLMHFLTEHPVRGFLGKWRYSSTYS
jgi:hypothetical protein